MHFLSTVQVENNEKKNCIQFYQIRGAPVRGPQGTGYSGNSHTQGIASPAACRPVAARAARGCGALQPSFTETN